MNWFFSPDLMGISPVLWVAAAVTFFLGGVVKGTLGVGLPLVVVPLLSLGVPTSSAIALVVFPVLASNTWQAYDSRSSRSNMRRFSPLLVTLVITTLITVPLTLALSASALNAMMAIAVITTVTLMALNPQLSISGPREQAVGAWVGALSGAMGGVSSLTGPIIITYLMALKLKREEFIGSISVIYLFGSIPLYAALAFYGRLQLSHLAISMVAMVPIALGMAIGKTLRGRIREEWFRRVLLLFLFAIAIGLLLK